MSLKGIGNKVGSNEKIARIEINDELLTVLRKSFTNLMSKNNDDKEQLRRFANVNNKLKIGINVISLNDMYDINNGLNEIIAELEKNPDSNVDVEELKARLKDFRNIQQRLK